MAPSVGMEISAIDFQASALCAAVAREMKQSSRCRRVHPPDSYRRAAGKGDHEGRPFMRLLSYRQGLHIGSGVHFALVISHFLAVRRDRHGRSEAHEAGEMRGACVAVGTTDLGKLLGPDPVLVFVRNDDATRVSPTDRMAFNR